MKTCYMCKEEKTLDCFDNDRTRPDKKFSYCKDCRRKYNGSKKLVRNIIGYYKDNPICLAKGQRYPTIGKQRAHRFIVEDIIGRKLERGEVVHHIDGDKENWEPENLCLMLDHRHRKLEGHKRMGYADLVVLKCNTCKKNKKYHRSVISKIIYPERYQCSSCYKLSGGPTGRKRLLELIK